MTGPAPDPRAPLLPALATAVSGNGLFIADVCGTQETTLLVGRNSFVKGFSLAEATKVSGVSIALTRFLTLE